MASKTRMAIALISVSVIGLEITLMRLLALRFWYYFASMVISVALLGFGCSGTALTLFQNRLRPHRRLWLVLLSFGASLSILVCAWTARMIPLDVHYLAWNLSSEMAHILEIECVMMTPFFLTGAFLGLAFMDLPPRIHGHYATNLAGSGAGAFLSIALMFHLNTHDLLIVWAFLCFGAGLCVMDWRHRWSALAGLTAGLVFLPAIWIFPAQVSISPYKKLALERSKPNTRIVHSEEGPLGRIDVVKGPAIHDAPPGMSLQNPYPIPKRSLLIVDGDQTRIIYDFKKDEDWQFLDYTTTALPFALGEHSEVLVIGPGGGAPLALARRHKSKKIIALEQNRRKIELLRKDFAAEGGRIYHIPEVQVHFEGARSHLRSKARYDLILIPMLDAAEAGGSGLRAAQENYLFTLESFCSCLHHLKDSGMLCATVYAKMPPRGGLRLFNLALEALKERKGASNHLALIRSWETVTLLAAAKPLNLSQLQKIRQFSSRCGFDLCYLPDLSPGETNQYHVLPEPYYFEGTKALVAGNRESYVQDYLFDLNIPTDDRPYFDNFMRWDRLEDLKKQLKGRMPAFLELGSLLLAAALLQVALLALVLIFLPLLPRSPALKKVKKKGGALTYFFLLGVGFMLLEMSFLQKMILYLGDPIHSAATVIASFLIFGGTGSLVSKTWRNRYAATWAGLIAAALAAVYLFLLDPWLGWAQSRSLTIRFSVVAVTIAPLAFVMGHMFPLGLRRVGENSPPMVPWCWASNGFASVLATAGAPLAAMAVGFSRLNLMAATCYLIASTIFLFILSREGSGAG
jgi:hypothetical protein